MQIKQAISLGVDIKDTNQAGGDVRLLLIKRKHIARDKNNEDNKDIVI